MIEQKSTSRSDQIDGKESYDVKLQSMKIGSTLQADGLVETILAAVIYQLPLLLHLGSERCWRCRCDWQALVAIQSFEGMHFSIAVAAIAVFALCA